MRNGGARGGEAPHPFRHPPLTGEAAGAAIFPPEAVPGGEVGGRRRDPGSGPPWWRGAGQVAGLGRRGRFRSVASASSARCPCPDRCPGSGRVSFAPPRRFGIAADPRGQRVRAPWRRRGTGTRGVRARLKQRLYSAFRRGSRDPLADRSGQVWGSADFPREPCPESVKGLCGR